MKILLALSAIASAAMIAGYASYMDRMPQPHAQTAVASPEPEAAQGPAVIELFTSQSCSSCPPADALAEELAQREDVIVISRPVTYWNRIGWEDTLSNPANTDLQRAYARRGLEGYNGVYTPQIVVDGRAGVVGSRQSDVAGLLEEALDDDRPSIEILPEGIVTIAGAPSQPAQLVIVAVDAHETVAIGAGENTGRTVTYTNSWLGEELLGAWREDGQVFAIPPTLPEAGRADRHALILREQAEDGGGRILAGRWLS